jgi:hypothetical protein
MFQNNVTFLKEIKFFFEGAQNLACIVIHFLSDSLRADTWFSDIEHPLTSRISTCLKVPVGNGGSGIGNKKFLMPR